MNLKIVLLIFLCFLFGCTGNIHRRKADIKNINADIKSNNVEEIEDTLLLDTVKYDQVTINNIPLRIDTLTAINMFRFQPSKNIHAFGTCYRFGDAKLWDFNGIRYYIYKDSLYFHDLYLNTRYKNRDFVVKLPNITISTNTKITEFKRAYPTSFANSKHRLSNTVIFRTGEPLQCQFRFEYRDGKLWRFLIGM